MVREGILKTEWMGFYDGKEIEPKGFSSLSLEQKALACDGLVSLLDGCSFGKTVKVTGPTPLASTSSYFAGLIAFYSVQRFFDQIKLHCRPSYTLKREKMGKIRGSIDFPRTLSNMGGVQGSSHCKYGELSWDDPLLCFAKAALEFTFRKISCYYGNIGIGSIRNAYAGSMAYLNQCPRDPSPYETAIRLVYGQEIGHRKYAPLLPSLRIMSHLLVSEAIGLSEKGSVGRTTDGFLVNLNRPFEFLLKLAMQSTGLFTPDVSSFNDIRFVADGADLGRAFTMIPDCRGFVSKGGKETYLLLDSKHKLMGQDVEEDEVGQYGRVNRGDFYQIISYSETHSIAASCEKVFGLVGLKFETGRDSELISRLPNIEVKHRGQSLVIQRYALCFGEILVRLGATYRTGGDPHSLLKELGDSFLEHALP